jgi:hypothetical protein
MVHTSLTSKDVGIRPGTPYYADPGFKRLLGVITGEVPFVGPLAGNANVQCVFVKMPYTCLVYVRKSYRQRFKDWLDWQWYRLKWHMGRV